jgi:hypothetical protein
MKIDWNEILGPIKIAELTYGKDASRFNGLNIIIKEINDVSDRWLDFIKENCIPKNAVSDRGSKDILDALNCVMTDIEMLRDNKWQPDEESCRCTLENLELIRDHIMTHGSYTDNEKVMFERKSSPLKEGDMSYPELTKPEDVES